VDLNERRATPLADVLSVTTGIMLARDLMNGVCGLVGWLERADPFPRLMDRDTIARLKAATEAAERHLLAQFPALADLRPLDGLVRADLYAWLLEAERAHGETLIVSRPASPRVIAAVDQAGAALREGAAGLARSLQAFTQAISGAKAAMDELAAMLPTDKQ
jgi:hypothetical protein